MAAVQRTDYNRILRPLAWLAVVVIVGLVFPPFHVRQIEPTAGAGPALQPTALDVRQFAQRFWHEQLPPAGQRATDSATVVAALARDPESALRAYGRRAGLGGNALYFIRGAGRVRAVDRRGVWLELAGGGGIQVLLVTGPLFGNALRDATGLLDVNNFSSFDFNALSAELNRIAEFEVQPVLERAVVGKLLQFVGCAEAVGEGDALKLKVMPISVEFPP